MDEKTFQRKQVELAQQAVRALRAGHDVAQVMGQKLGASQILLTVLP
jgi:hypothetical protein